MVLPFALASISMVVLTAAEPLLPDCATAPVRLELAVHGLRSDRGLVTVVVYGDRPDEFLAKGRRLVKARLPATGGAAAACIPLPHAGTFAVAAYHDEDSDGRFNRSRIGLPTEGFGFSNDPATLAGLPAFDAVTFVARPGPNAVTVRMRYP